MQKNAFSTMIEIVAEGGNVNDFGFHIEGSFCEALKAFLKNNVKENCNDHLVFWKDAIARMSENYNKLLDKDTADFLVTFDFEKEKKHGIWLLLPSKLFLNCQKKAEEHY